MTEQNELYYNRVMGKTIDELRNDANFQQDLVTFFQSARHGYSGEKIRERGVSGLMEDFAEHMRYQENNEVTALRDLYFASGRDEGTQGQRDAFGRLMTAWDNSDGTEMSFGKAFDYVESIATAPSTWATAVTAGTGKLAARAGVKGTQIATRRAIASTIARESVGQAVARGAARGAIAEGAQSAAQEAINQGTRVRAIDDYQFDVGDVAIAGVAGGVFGGAAGALSRIVGNTQANKAIDILEERAVNVQRIASEKSAAATATLSRTKPMMLNDFIDDMLNYNKSITEIATGAHKSRTGSLPPLPQNEVAAGERIRRVLMNKGGADEKSFTIGGLNSDAIRGLAAAYADLKTAFNAPEGKRISAIVADAIRDGDLDNIDVVKAIRDKYGLSSDEFSHLYMAELSNAGRLLNAQSQIAKKTGRATSAQTTKQLEAAQSKFDAIVADARELFKRRVSTVSDDQLDDIATQAGKDHNGFVQAVRNFDSMRIAFMTSQLATTAANVSFGIGRLGVDVVDNMFYNMINGKNPFRGSFSTIAGLVTNRRVVEVMDMMIDQDAPDYIAKYLTDISRAEGQTGHGWMATAGKAVNLFNAYTDRLFKNAMFYSSLDRHLADLGDETLGTSFEAFARSGKNFTDIPEDTVRKAVDDALRFTFQRSYYGEKTMFAQGAQELQKLHKRIPFLISSAMPFPRFIANQLEFIHDYMPGVGALGIMRELREGAVPTKNMAERLSRQMTGTALLGAAYAFRAQQGTDTKWNQYIDEDGRVQDLSRIAGPMNAFLVVADAIYRYRNDDELNVETYQLATELGEQLGATGFVPDSAPLANLIKAITTGESNASVSNLIPDLIATFTYPLATFRDIYGQIDPRSSQTPYTKTTAGDETVISLFDLVDIKSSHITRATRFLPDVPWVQVNESLEGQYDLQYWNPFSNEPITSVDPITKQFTGRSVSPELTEMQRDMNRFNIDEYEAYKGNKNPTVDYAVRYALANTVNMPDAWVQWKTDNAELWNSASPEYQRDLMRNYIQNLVQDVTANVTASYENLVDTNPVAARGYIRNVFQAKMSEFKRLGYSDPNDQFRTFLESNGYPPMDIKEYILSGESLEDELTNMQRVVGILDNAIKTRDTLTEY